MSRYFVHEGLTSYTHISDQYSTYGTQIIVSTERDATFTLDEILGNTTELAIAEHTTDSHGQTLVNACILSTTGYLEDAVHAHQTQTGHPVSSDAKAHVSPAHFEAINPYGTLIFDIAGVLKRSRRPLRHQ